MVALKGLMSFMRFLQPFRLYGGFIDLMFDTDFCMCVRPHIEAKAGCRENLVTCSDGD